MKRFWSVFLTAFVVLAPASMNAGTQAQIKPRDIVIALSIHDNVSPCLATEAIIDSMVNADGSVGPLVIPAGKVLVITSLEWTSFGAVANTHYAFVIRNADKQNSIVAGAGTISDGGGDMSGSLQIPTGLVIRSGMNLCTSANNTSIGRNLAFTRLHGYFTKDE